MMRYDLVGEVSPPSDQEVMSLLQSGDGAALINSGDVDLLSGAAAGIQGLHRLGGGSMADRVRAVAHHFKVQGANEIAAKLQAKHQVALTDRPFDRANLVPAGFNLDLDASGSGATATFTLTATTPFKIVQVMADPVTAPYVRIQSMTMGQKSFILGNGSLPATCLIPEAVGDFWKFDTLQTSQQLFMVVTNTSGQALTFEGAFWGTMVT